VTLKVKVKYWVFYEWLTKRRVDEMTWHQFLGQSNRTGVDLLFPGKKWIGAH
jgi:hypothetical protein